MKINFNERIEECQSADIKTSFDEKEDLFEKKIKAVEGISKEDAGKQSGRYIYFSGKADVNSDYGQGGGNQYFIQNASLLKRKGNLVAVDREICKFSPETDLYSPNIREQNGRLIHLDNRPLMKEDAQQLEATTLNRISLNVGKYDVAVGNQNADGWDSKITKEELKYLDENTADVEWQTRNPSGWKREDFYHPAGNQEDSEGKNHPDVWTNPQELKDGTIYYQLLPNFRDGSQTETSYFTDKETIDSCRDENGVINLSSLMQKLQKDPNKEKRTDSEGNTYETYVEEYSVIQYKFKENILKD